MTDLTEFEESDGSVPTEFESSAPAETTFNAYLAAIGRYPLLSAEEELALGREAIQGSIVARDRLVVSNLRLVVNIASDFRNQGVEIEDLVAEGHFGLIRAAEKFDPKMGCRFTTYAYQWIFQSVDRAVMNLGSTVRVPVNKHREIRLLNPREFALVCHFNELSGHPYKSRKAMARELSLSTTRISQIYQTALKKMQTALAEQYPSWTTPV